MLRFLTSQLRFRRSRTAALAAAVLVAATSFMLLTAAGKTTELRVRGSVESNFRAAYDVLVRPRDTRTALERSQRLVRPNYLSGIFGGISREQWQRVKRIPGVDVAAPIANVGYILHSVSLPVSIENVLTKDPVQLYRLRFGFRASNGTSRYPGGTGYVYYTRRNPLFLGSQGVSELPPSGPELPVCSGFLYGAHGVENLDQLVFRRFFTDVGPFKPRSYLRCFSSLSPGEGSDQDERFRRVGSGWNLSFPLLVAAVDPVEEARLLGLERTLVAGRYLRADDRTRVWRARQRDRSQPGRRRSARLVPAIASTRPFLDEQLEVRIERLRIPPGIDVPKVLASRRAFHFVTRLPARPVERRTISPRAPYERALRENRTFALRGSFLNTPNVWTPADVEYERTGPLRLTPTVTSNLPSIWKHLAIPSTGGYYPAPISNTDVQFRVIHAHVLTNAIENNLSPVPTIHVVGRFDPAKLPGFSPLSRVPLETYYPPLVEPADAASRRALGGRPLLPTQNLGDYIQQPPLVLTSLAAVDGFLNENAYINGGTPLPREAPISAIRVKVAGVRGADELSIERIRRVATQIRDATGLEVDITAGSSPQRVVIDLPPGKFGRPPLLLAEGWSKKGVSVSFLDALDDKRLGLLALILVSCCFFLANGAYAAVRQRRAEIGTLLTLGWSQRSIFLVVLAELALIGVVAGLAGVVVGVLAVLLLSLELSLVQTLAIAPLATLLALLAGLLPAWRASRLAPMDAVRPAIAGKVHGRRVRGFGELALANLRRVPARSLVAVASLFVGVAALTALLAINSAFSGTLVGTLLGEAISLQVRGIDFLSVGLVIGLAALSVADVLFLNLRDRSAELVTLRTTGWGEGHLRRLVVLEAVILGLLGSLSGAVAGLLLGVLLDVPLGTLLGAALVAAAGGILVALLASLAPLSQINRLLPTTVLAAE